MAEELTGLTPWLAWLVIFLGGGLGGVAKYCLYASRMPALRLVKDVLIGVVAAFVGVLVLPFDLSSLITHNLLLKLFAFSLLAGVGGKAVLDRTSQEILERSRARAHEEYTKRIDEIETRIRAPSRRNRRND